MSVPTFRPMLATPSRGHELGGSGWSLEPKLDGWRALVTVEGDRGAQPQRGRVVTSGVPELSGLGEQLSGRTAVLDGELIVGAGTPTDFHDLTPRMALSPRRLPRHDRRAGAAVTHEGVPIQPRLVAPEHHRRDEPRGGGALVHLYVARRAAVQTCSHALAGSVMPSSR